MQPVHPGLVKAGSVPLELLLGAVEEDAVTV